MGDKVRIVSCGKHGTPPEYANKIGEIIWVEKNAIYPYKVQIDICDSNFHKDEITHIHADHIYFF